LIGVWDNNFGKSIKDYSDAIKIRYFDENSRIFKYIKKGIRRIYLANI